LDRLYEAIHAGMAAVKETGWQTGGIMGAHGMRTEAPAIGQFIFVALTKGWLEG
jgi:hypothetical protein